MEFERHEAAGSPRLCLHGSPPLAPALRCEPFARSKGFDLVTLCRQPQTASALFASADPQVPDCCLHREALPVGGVTICLLEGACDFAKPAAHLSHARRSRPGGKRSQIAPRRVMSAARRIAFSSTVPASYRANLAPRPTNASGRSIPRLALGTDVGRGETQAHRFDQMGQAALHVDGTTAQPREAGGGSMTRFISARPVAGQTALRLRRDTGRYD
jgi:hypothetical protein